MKKKNMLIIGIAVSIALMLSIGITMAQQIQGSVATGSEECQQCNPHNPNEDYRDVMCPGVDAAAPYIEDMIAQGHYPIGKGDPLDPSPEQVLQRLDFLQTEWCPFDTPGDWGAGGFEFHFLTALAACALVMLGLLGLPYLIAAFAAVSFLIGISVYGVITMVLLEFGMDYATEIANAYWHCVEILTGGA